MKDVSLLERSSPGEVWDHDPGESVDQPEHGDPDEGEPPEPEDEEVLLVEQVVGEDAQVVRPVDRSSGGADSDVARHLGGLDTSEEVDYDDDGGDDVESIKSIFEL